MNMERLRIEEGADKKVTIHTRPTGGGEEEPVIQITINHEHQQKPQQQQLTQELEQSRAGGFGISEETRKAANTRFRKLQEETK